nr:translation initiation factor IF-2-like [Aegilops tauschii subsp. strangulata]
MAPQPRRPGAHHHRLRRRWTLPSSGHHHLAGLPRLHRVVPVPHLEHHCPVPYAPPVRPSASTFPLPLPVQNVTALSTSSLRCPTARVTSPRVHPAPAAPPGPCPPRPAATLCAPMQPRSGAPLPPTRRRICRWRPQAPASARVHRCAPAAYLPLAPAAAAASPPCAPVTAHRSASPMRRRPGSPPLAVAHSGQTPQRPDGLASPPRSGSAPNGCTRNRTAGARAR